VSGRDAGEAVRILFLDDNPLDVELIAHDLRRGGLAVEPRRATGRETFERAVDEGRLDLVLADHDVPGYGGRQALALVKQRLPGVPFILVTGTLDEETAVGYMRDGAADFLLKDRRARLVPAVLGALAEAERQRQLSRHRELLDSVLESSPAVIYVKDRLGRFVLANRAAAELFGVPARELVGRREEDLATPPEQVEQRRRHRQEVLDEDRPLTVDEEPFTRAGGGATRWFRTVRSPLHLSSEPDALVLAVAVDVSERRELETRLRRVERLEAVGQLAGGVAHDFNNLLMVVLGHSELLLASGDPSAKDLTFHLGQIRQAGESGAVLTRQLLAFGGRQVLQPRHLDLNELVAHVEPMLRRVLGENLEVVSELAPDPWPVHADEGQLQQVLINLLVNARDAMPGGGRIVVATANRPAGPAAGRRVELRVSDTGVGMDADTQARMFEPFFTTKEEGHGTGLGLSTVHGIVEQSGGSVEVDSSPGAGTTVRVLLPAAERAATAAAAAGSTAAPRPAGGETVLVVEDQEPVRRLVVLALEQQGYRVRQAASLAEARLELAGPGAVDLLLTDVVLADGSGGELAAEMRASRPRLPVLLMSGHAAPEALPDEADPLCELLPKPFRPAELGRRVRRLLDRV
jgi:PAS domain S-box-containing protein